MNGIVGCIGMLIGLAFAIFVGGYCVQYDVQFWASYIKHAPVVVPFLPCAVAGIFLSQFAIPIALLTWVLSYVL